MRLCSSMGSGAAGKIRAGQTVSLDGKESCDYPVSYSYAAAQMVTGADQYEKAEMRIQII